MADAITDVLMKMAGNVLWWLNIILSYCFLYIIIYYHTTEQRRLPNRPKGNNIEPHH